MGCFDKLIVLDLAEHNQWDEKKIEMEVNSPNKIYLYPKYGPNLILNADGHNTTDWNTLYNNVQYWEIGEGVYSGSTYWEVDTELGFNNNVLKVKKPITLENIYNQELTASSELFPIQCSSINKVYRICFRYKQNNDTRQAIDISSSILHKLEIDNFGNIWAWGDNSYGQLGNNTTINYCTPTAPNLNIIKKTFCQISAGYYHSSAIDKNGQVWSWGRSSCGELGNNENVCKYTPVSIHGTKKTFCKISSGLSNTLAIDKYGKVWGWGYNNYGQLGDNTLVHRCTPVQMCLIHSTFCHISSGFGYTTSIDKNGQVWSWGINTYGQLGYGQYATFEKYPVSLAGNKKTFCKISAGNYSLPGNVTPTGEIAAHTLAIDNYGQVWAWGVNTFGQLGNNEILYRMTPVSIHGTKKTFCEISTGHNSSYGIDRNGVAWSWGWNGCDQWWGCDGLNPNTLTYGAYLGNDDWVPKKTPVNICFGRLVQLGWWVPNHHKRLKISKCMALDEYGQIWTWGINNKGQLGINANPDIFYGITARNKAGEIHYPDFDAFRLTAIFHNNTTCTYQIPKHFANPAEYKNIDILSLGTAGGLKGIRFNLGVWLPPGENYPIDNLLPVAGGAYYMIDEINLVGEYQPDLIVDFIGNPLSGNSPLDVNFTDLTLGYPTNWNWSFGDNTFSFTQNPTKKYNNSGSYSVTLTVGTFPNTVSLTKSNYITVN